MRLRKRESSPPADVSHVVQRLRAERPIPTVHEFDRAKIRAMAQGGQTGTKRVPRTGNGVVIKSRRVVSVALAIGLMGGTTAVIAKSGGPSTAASPNSSASSQYCPPTSQQPGKPKKPGPAKCGNPKTK
jgi:hypothetical protein